MSRADNDAVDDVAEISARWVDVGTLMTWVVPSSDAQTRRFNIDHSYGKKATRHVYHLVIIMQWVTLDGVGGGGFIWLIKTNNKWPRQTGLYNCIRTIDTLSRRRSGFISTDSHIAVDMRPSKRCHDYSQITIYNALDLGL